MRELFKYMVLLSLSLSLAAPAALAEERAERP